MTDPVDVERIARGLTAAQVRDLCILADGPFSAPKHERPTRALWRIGLLERAPISERSFVFRITDLGREVAAHLRATTEGEG